MKTIGKIFGTTVKVDRLTWLPVVPLAVWGVMAVLAGRPAVQWAAGLFDLLVAASCESGLSGG